MAVFRVEKTKDFTIMCNHHLRNTELSLKAKGLLSLMLSLPEDWDYTTKGLAHICKDGISSLRSMRLWADPYSGVCVFAGTESKLLAWRPVCRF